ncbi:MAG: FAD:protein FMN transferase [Ruminococcus sp.]|nr:FAD:protein FMN transferase [Ruminococcus sp.]
MKRISVVFCLTALLVTGCGKKEPIKGSRDIFAMDTYMNLQAYGDAPEDALEKAETEILRLEKLLSVTDNKSETYKLNASGGSPTEVDADVSELIRYGIDMGKKTKGSLDITVYPVLREWGFTTGEYNIPTDGRIDELLKNVDYSKIILDENTVTLPVGAEVDFGAVAKGFTSDRVMEIFKENGVSSAIISLGGNVQTMGRKTDGSLWKVAVVDPFDTDKTLGIIETADKAVITSGNYERYFTGEDGRNYCHIIDPSTGRPAENGLVSVTIIGESGLMCDALSTAIFVMGRDKAVDFWRSYDDFEMILVESNGNIVITDGIEDSFENLSGLDLEVIAHES